jgi:hypothetical protein
MSLTTREAVLVPSGEVAAEACFVTVRWNQDDRKPVRFGQAACRSSVVTCCSLPVVRGPVLPGG